jgi:hypothetical protein
VMVMEGLGMTKNSIEKIENPYKYKRLEK